MLLQWVSAIAADMASGKAAEEIINETLQQLQKVTGSDMAYISLNTETETFISYSTGIKTAAYRDIRMPLGSGVLGKAALGKGAISTSNYHEDEQIIHLPQIDQRVKKEGVKSIIGMPMTLNSTVHGALLLADRKSVEYSPAVREILATIALHTTVVIANAQRISEVEAAHARLHATHESAFFDILVKEGRIGDLDEIYDVHFPIHERNQAFFAVFQAKKIHAAKLKTLLEAELRTLPKILDESILLTRGAKVWLIGTEKNQSVIINHLKQKTIKQFNLNCGTSTFFADPASAPSAHRTASRALDTLNLLAAGGRVLAGETLGALGYLVEAVMRDPFAPGLLNAISPLTQYDARHKGSLTQTAWVLAEHAFNTRLSAQKLYVHENTVRQRLSRISQIMGENWREPERLLDIHLALRVWALVNL